MTQNKQILLTKVPYMIYYTKFLDEFHVKNKVDILYGIFRLF